MLKALFGLFLIAPALALGADKVSPVGFTVTIHVQSSQLLNSCSSDEKGSSCFWQQKLTVQIDGKNYELLQERNTNAVLRPGEYMARIVKDDTSHAYEYFRIYEILFADGTTRKYDVIGETE